MPNLIDKDTKKNKKAQQQINQKQQQQIISTTMTKNFWRCIRKMVDFKLGRESEKDSFSSAIVTR